jgi:hypothetical protein
MRYLFFFFILTNTFLMGQNNPPLNEIPAAPENAVAGNVIARMVQGLGYRYYWASKDLRIEDLSYRPSKEGASTFETLEHIYGLAEVIRNAATSSPTIRPLKSPPKDYIVLREKTLEYLEQANALYLNKTAAEVDQMQVIFQRANKLYDYPVWNLLNGPLADAIYHTGQLVSFRRTSGNPLQQGVNVFIGKTKE